MYSRWARQKPTVYPEISSRFGHPMHAPSAQGLSLDYVLADLHAYKKIASLHYTACSRVRTADGLFFVPGGFAAEQIHVNPDVVAFMNYMRTHRNIQLQLRIRPITEMTSIPRSESFVLVAHNTTPLSRYFRNLVADADMCEADCLHMSETLLHESKGASNFQLPEHCIAGMVPATGAVGTPHHGSMIQAKASCNSTCTAQHSRSGVELLVTIMRPPHPHEASAMNVIGLYRPPSSSVSEFVQLLRECLEHVGQQRTV